MSAIVTIDHLSKSFASGTDALTSVSLDIEEGEILALLGPNGAGKTTLISIICGISNATSGTIRVGGHDVVSAFRKARRLIGLVPQEVSIEPFETVINTVSFSRGLFGLRRDPDRIEAILKDLSLWDKRDSKLVELSGGMKRRVLIAKALAHEPRVLFLDEPTAGVDVELRRDMWALVERLRADGVTIILTTHYIEEAEAIADRVAVIAKGEILLVEDKNALMKRMGQKTLRVELAEPLATIPKGLEAYDLALEDGKTLIFRYETKGERTGITRLLNDLSAVGVHFADIETQKSSLEDIFVSLVSEDAQ
ncbi:MAG: ABC transporter ATP-binding protein [Pseudomonadota bacterium]